MTTAILFKKPIIFIFILTSALMASPYSTSECTTTDLPEPLALEVVEEREMVSDHPRAFEETPSEIMRPVDGAPSGLGGRPAHARGGGGPIPVPTAVVESVLESFLDANRSGDAGREPGLRGCNGGAGGGSRKILGFTEATQEERAGSSSRPCSGDE